MKDNRQQNANKSTRKIDIRELNAINKKALKASNSSVKARHVAMFVGKINPKDLEKIEQAIQNKNSREIDDVYSRVNFKEGYINYADLEFPDGSSVQRLQVTAYSSQTSDQELLHHLLTKTS